MVRGVLLQMHALVSRMGYFPGIYAVVISLGIASMHPPPPPPPLNPSPQD